MAATTDGWGYWMVASDGGIFAFGDAPFYGSGTGGSLTAPAVGIAARPGGYWIAFGQTADWNTPLGQEELLAGLGYMPLSWSPSSASSGGGPNIPPQLTALWSPGQYNQILKGAIWAFEAVSGLPMDGKISPAEIGALLARPTTRRPTMNPNGYTYSLAQEHQGTHDTRDADRLAHRGGGPGDLGQYRHRPAQRPLSAPSRSTSATATRS